MTTQFTTHQSFYCQWTSGAKEYFPTLDQAIEKAKSLYDKKDTMSDENHAYWLKQKSIIGKEITIDQELDIIDVHHEVFNS